MIDTLGAEPRRRALRGRRGKQAEPQPPPTPVATSRATLIGAAPLTSAPAHWLRGADLDAEADAALAVIASVVHIHRSAAADPHVPVPGRERALVMRVGYGGGEQVADGRWTDAVEVPAPKPRKRAGAAVLRPQERLAAILGGRDVALACEELTLRARLDADAGRWREATFQLRVALEAAIAELGPWSAQGDVGSRIEELRELRGSVGEAANRALQSGLDNDSIRVVRNAIERVEAALRARTHAELGG